MKNDAKGRPSGRPQAVGRIHSVETFGSVDGPGVRYVIFLQGCRMRCKYCHNPETWATEGGEPATAEQMVSAALRYRSYWGKRGGITVSGGEPLLQMDFVIDLFTRAKEAGIHTCLDTAGNPFTMENPFFRKMKELIQVTDLFLLDLKEMDSGIHRKLTGWGNENILRMASWLSDQGKKMWIRHVLVPGWTDQEEDVREMSRFIDSLKTVRRVEVLPYHTLGIFKWEKLRIPYGLSGVRPPDNEEELRANEILNTADYRGYLED